MSGHITSLEFHCLDTVIETIKEMARQGVFTPLGDDNIRKVRPESVVGRIGASGRQRSSSNQSGELGIDTPGFIVTYLGHTFRLEEGENCYDDGTIQILIQLVDKTTTDDLRNAESYFRWVDDVKQHLQDNPLDVHTDGIGEIFLTHVNSQHPPKEHDWAVLEQMKLPLMVICRTRVPRNTERTRT